MATIGRTNGASTPAAPKRSYISMKAFNNDIFSYSYGFNSGSMSFVGSLNELTGATSGNCPQGRLLTETGRKLYPGVNPGVATYMVGVYDLVSGLSGFIDPNSYAFTIQNTDRPYWVGETGTNPNSGTPAGKVSDQGAPVLTRGDVIAAGDLDLGGNADVDGTMDISGATTMRSTLDVTDTTTLHNDVTLTAGADLNLSSTSRLKLPGITGIALLSSVPDVAPGSFKYLTVSNSNCTPTSRIFLTYTGLNQPGVLCAESITTGQFVIVSTSNDDKGSVQYLIIDS
jgi:hypothetical protein